MSCDHQGEERQEQQSASEATVIMKRDIPSAPKADPAVGRFAHAT